MLPVILLLLFGCGVSLDAEHVPIALVIEKPTPDTTSFCAELEHSIYFEPIYVHGMPAAKQALMERRVDAILHLREDFCAVRRAILRLFRRACQSGRGTAGETLMLAGIAEDHGGFTLKGEVAARYMVRGTRSSTLARTNCPLEMTIPTSLFLWPEPSLQERLNAEWRSAAVVWERPSPICEGLRFLGIELQESRNAKATGVISTDASQATVRVIRTDEEQVIAQSTCRVLGLGAARL